MMLWRGKTLQISSRPGSWNPVGIHFCLDAVQGFQMQMLSVSQVAPEALDGPKETPVPEAEPTVPAPPPTKPAWNSLDACMGS